MKESKIKDLRNLFRLEKLETNDATNTGMRNFSKLKNLNKAVTFEIRIKPLKNRKKFSVNNKH